MVRIISFDPAIKNLAYCILVFNDETKQIERVEKIKLIDITKGKPCKTIQFDNLIENLLESLNGILLSGVDIVLIENQPCRLNPKVKSISVALYTYFKLKKIEKVKFVSPSSKLTKEQNKLPYKKRKELGIEKAHSLVSEETKKEILGYDKRDDISDCILNAYYYLN